MTTKHLITKENVKSLLIKWGNNENDVNKMIHNHFEYAKKYCKSLKHACEYIRTVY